MLPHGYTSISEEIYEANASQKRDWMNRKRINPIDERVIMLDFIGQTQLFESLRAFTMFNTLVHIRALFGPPFWFQIQSNRTSLVRRKMLQRDIAKIQERDIHGRIKRKKAPQDAIKQLQLNQMASFHLCLLYVCPEIPVAIS
jgi:hypothetical protein